MKVKQFNWLLRVLLPKDVTGITLCPFGIYIKDEIPDKITIQHELIHWEQQKEMLILPFYVLYLIEYIFKGYYKISFEAEAYQNQFDNSYLRLRKHYAWLKWVFKK